MRAAILCQSFIVDGLPSQKEGPQQGGLASTVRAEDERDRLQGHPLGGVERLIISN